jgi:hypothetical protein
MTPNHSLSATVEADRCGRNCDVPMRRQTYVVTLVIQSEHVEPQRFTDNCKHALQGALQLLDKIPQSEVCVRVEGRLVFWAHTNFRGQIDEIDSYFRPGAIVDSLNPNWERWYINRRPGAWPLQQAG